MHNTPRATMPKAHPDQCRGTIANGVRNAHPDFAVAAFAVHSPPVSFFQVIRVIRYEPSATHFHHITIIKPEDSLFDKDRIALDLDNHLAMLKLGSIA